MITAVKITYSLFFYKKCELWEEIPHGLQFLTEINCFPYYSFHQRDKKIKEQFFQRHSTRRSTGTGKSRNGGWCRIKRVAPQPHTIIRHENPKI